MPSRISTTQIFDRTQAHIRSAKEKENTSAEKSISGKELTRPSQAPAEWVIAQNIRDDITVREGIARNASIATHVLTATENIISQAQDIVQKAHEPAISASSGDILGDTSRHVLPEVEGLYKSMIQTLNTKFENRTLLSGFSSNKPAFDMEGNFLGDTGKIQIEIDKGLKIPINVNARQVVFGEGLNDGVNILSGLKELMQGLSLNDKDMIRGSLGTLHKSTDQLSIARTQIAGSMTEIERAVNTNGANTISSKDAVSKIEDADAIKVFSDLAKDQTVLRAAIGTTHKLLSESPVDILFK